MSTSTYIIDSALVLLVLLQIKEKPITIRQLVRPLVILGVAVASYFTTLPTAGNDLLLIGVIGLIGALIGTASGLTAIVRRRSDGIVTLRSGWVSGFFWVLGMGARFAFAFWISHGGMSTITSFSASHQITTGSAWTDALLAMAVFEVLLRTAIVALRWKQLETSAVPVLA